MSSAGRAFDNAELIAYMAEVDALLSAHVEIAVIGGVAISFNDPSRFSDDVDVVSENMPQGL